MITVAEEILQSIEEYRRISAFKHVEIGLGALPSAYNSIIQFREVSWDSSYVLNDFSDRGFNYLGIFAALSFCYWPEPKWHILMDNNPLDGSNAMMYVLKNIFEESEQSLPELGKASFFENFHGIDDTRLVFLEERFDLFQEIVSTLKHEYESSFKNLFEENDWDANKINKCLVTKFKAFNDTVVNQKSDLKIFKKSQEFINMVSEQFSNKVSVKNLNDLTLPADYKIPQILNHLGLLTYKEPLENKILNKTVLRADSREATEIRIATILIGEKLKAYACLHKSSLSINQISNRLWAYSQLKNKRFLPYPRILSIWV